MSTTAQTPDHRSIAPAKGQVWSNSALADPHHDAGKQEKVGRMFASIARRYDLNNRVHSLWLDQTWRRTAARAADLTPADRVLDVACGTGDLTHQMAKGVGGKAGAAPAEVVGLDYTPAMLDIARYKAARLPQSLRDHIRYLQGDAQHLPFGDAEFDVLSIAFGIRNVGDPMRALAEFRRVLRPGGRLVILEFTTPGFWPVRVFNDIYCRRIMPITATLIARDRSGAYRYLPRSVEKFATSTELAQMIRDAGFTTPTIKSLSLGICACYRAVAV